MSSFDICHIPQSSKTEVDELFTYFTHEFYALGDVHAENVPLIAAQIYHRADATRRCALAHIIDQGDFTQYALAVGQFCALVSLLQGILKG